ncbi:ribosome biogenesis protein ytm1 [Maublancomyces gigas]|uniref:Ribosome biogenesis protein YTM1 n=1 Tax=Discina gigas TaxID=1032678 RepID=A0ABR3GYA0_9PEZI
MASIPMDTDIPPLVQQLQVQVKFVTRHPDIAVPTAPILVPSNLKRYGLSQIINHLLDTATPVPFDFLTGGAFLRTSLDAHLQSNGLSAESVITLEYVRAVVPPKFQAAFQHDDWVSSVSTAVFDGDNTLTRILSGSYDGIARVWNLSGQVLAEAPGHNSAIKSVKWLDNGAQFVTSSMDRTLHLWSYSDDAIVPVAEFLGHKATVENIAVHSASHRILSASADSTVGLWSTQSSECPAAPTDILPPKPKKRKTTSSPAVVAATAAPRYGPLGLLSGHSSPVSAVTFDPKDPTVAYSVSWDHTIRTWDLPTQALVDTRTTQHPILSVCVLPGLSLLACGSSARHITLHDPRASASTVATSTLRGHTNAVVALCADGQSEWQMASAGHDGTVRVWDVRAAGSGSMFTIKREGGEVVTGREKVFDVEWSRIGIVSGGSDKRVQINETPRAGEESVVVEKL